jgi:hypothetical protein
VWNDFFALTFVEPGADPSRYVTAMSASLGYGEDNSALASWSPDMGWQGPRYFHIALPSPLEVWIDESSFAAWKDSGQLKVELPNITLEMERVPGNVVNRQLP